MGQVAARPTPITPAAAERILRSVAPELTDRQGVLRLLLALWDLETGGGSAQTNHNWGNIIATRDSQPWYIDVDSGNLRRFRSYDSSELGAEAFVRQLTSPTRSQWHAGLLTGDPHQFARSLGGILGGPAYYEADPETYEGILRGRWNKYDHLSSGKRPASSSLLFFSEAP